MLLARLALKRISLVRGGAITGSVGVNLLLGAWRCEILVQEFMRP